MGEAGGGELETQEQCHVKAFGGYSPLKDYKQGAGILCQLSAVVSPVNEECLERGQEQLD